MIKTLNQKIAQEARKIQEVEKARGRRLSLEQRNTRSITVDDSGHGGCNTYSDGSDD